MTRKISFIMLAAAIIVTGIIALSKLNYLQQSVRVFQSGPAGSFEGRAGRGQGNRGEFDRPTTHQRPDNFGERFSVDNQGEGRFDRNVADSLRQKAGADGRERFAAGSFKGGLRNGEGRGRGDFQENKKIYLQNVFLFLAVFALFTVMAIYLDKAINQIIRKKAKQDC